MSPSLQAAGPRHRRHSARGFEGRGASPWLQAVVVLLHVEVAALDTDLLDLLLRRLAALLGDDCYAARRAAAAAIPRLYGSWADPKARCCCGGRGLCIGASLHVVEPHGTVPELLRGGNCFACFPSLEPLRGQGMKLLLLPCRPCSTPWGRS